MITLHRNCSSVTLWPVGLILSVWRRSAIISAQESLWGTVKSRVHYIHKVYSASPAGDNLMVFGIVEWTFNDGRTLDGAFASRFIVETDGSDGPRMKLFQAWAVSTALEGRVLMIAKIVIKVSC